MAGVSGHEFERALKQVSFTLAGNALHKAKTHVSSPRLYELCYCRTEFAHLTMHYCYLAIIQTEP